jgi:hypothetical protein
MTVGLSSKKKFRTKSLTPLQLNFLRTRHESLEKFFWTLCGGRGEEVFWPFLCPNLQKIYQGRGGETNCDKKS